MPTQLLVDGHSLLFRAYHALPPLATATGVPTGALHGFASMLLKVMTDERPDRVVVVFDAPSQTFRHEAFETYKAQREEAPDDFRQQVPLVQEWLQLMAIPVLVIPGYEADDTLGTLATMGQQRGYHTLILSGDRDLLQLVNAGVTVLLTARRGISEIERMDRDAVKQKMGVYPEEIPDLKGLMGDSSDNIPGIPGIGAKTAVALIERYHHIDALYEALEELDNPRWAKLLRDHGALARQYRDLATIVTTVPVDWPEVTEPYQVPDTPALRDFLRRLELHAVAKRLGLETAAEPVLADWPTVRERQAPMPAGDRLYYVWWDHKTLWVYDPEEQAYWRTAFDRAALGGRWIVWDAKSFYRQALASGLPLPPIVHDGEVLAYLLDAEAGSYGLLDVARRYQLPLPTNPLESLLTMAGLWPRLERELTEAGLASLYYDVERPLTAILAGMEHVGVRVDAERLKALGAELDEALVRLEREIYELAGSTFNINSPAQLGDVLFNRLGLPVVKRTKTGWSTDAETLETLAPLHPVVDKVLQYRQLMKLKGTYVDGLLPLIGPDARIHTTFHQTGTATGRLSSSDPNLQNIPVRVPLGRRIRGVFVPSPGRELLAADYSQIELRILAHLADDEHLRAAFEAGEDIHRRTASEIFGIPWDAVDNVWRSRAKAVNFGIIYGISDFGLARDTGVSRQEAHDYIARYFARYPKLKQYFDQVVETARETGEVRTILGRRRPLPDIRSKNRVKRQYAERMAMNTAIQGSAADLIKAAMVRLQQAAGAAGLQSQLILQVHDELIWDAVPEELPTLLELAASHMTRALALSVPLVVEFKRGLTWETMEPIEGTAHHA